MTEHKNVIAETYRNAGFEVKDYYQNGIRVGLNNRKVGQMEALIVADIEELPIYADQITQTSSDVFINC
jgi:hypothetical protein